MALASHTFIDGKFYSYRTLEKLIGITHQGIRGRSIQDRWPLADIYDENENRTNLVDGGFLEVVQQEVRRSNDLKL